MRRHQKLLFLFVIMLVVAVALTTTRNSDAVVAAAAPSNATVKVDPELRARLAAADATASTKQLGVLLTFQGSRVTDAHTSAVRALGIQTGVRMQNLPIMAVNASPAQIAQLVNLSGLRSVYLNTPLELYMHQTKPLIGVSRLRADTSLRNATGQPFSGKGVTIAINDSGIDAGHPDLKMDMLNRQAGKTIQNVVVNPNDQDGLVVRTGTTGNPIQGILPPSYIEDVLNTDTHVGHGTHCAGIAAGTGQQSGTLYQGVAPGAKLVGLGSGGVLFVLGQVAAFDYVLSNHFNLNIKVVSNSWGNSAVALDPDHPINVASKALHDEGIVVVFANGNDGARPNTQNRWASFPWLLSAGAATKDFRLASFSSRGIFGDTEVHPTVVVPGTGGPAEKGFTSAVVATRSVTNIVANGADADTEIPAGFLPYYTQISGTSMACPHLAGIVATLLEANPKLTPDQVRAIIERTATPMASYDTFEVGTGMANVHAAVDLALNPQKLYGNFGFEGKGLALSEQATQTFDGTVPARGATTQNFEVPADARFAYVQVDWNGALGEDELVVDNTKIVAADIALTIQKDGQTIASSNATNLAALFGARESVKLEFPAAGTYTARISAGLGGAGAPVDQPFTLTVKTYTFDVNQAADLGALDATTRTRALRLIYDRVMFTSGNFFRPDDALTRMELAQAMMFGTRVMQYLPNRPTFGDIAAGTSEELVAESLRREGLMGLDGTTFGAATQVMRLEEAVALVRALRLDAQARALAGTNVTSGGVTLTDNAQIPPALRGYVQLAIDRGLLEVYPAEVKQIASGQFVALPGPRVEPMRGVKRAEFIAPATKLLQEMFGE
ncbi:MAG TPA: S8 family serine peptidase [Pyrinomonadaceae bacterium]|nr:S8 family serine peptidase [Pyrinomonadaceae bacterium]